MDFHDGLSFVFASSFHMKVQVPSGGLAQALYSRHDVKCVLLLEVARKLFSKSCTYHGV